jgi:peptidoglycan/LPS O-acetylase OafA/YrhL
VSAAAQAAPMERSGVKPRSLAADKLIALDGIRGIAILAVMGHHSFWLIQSTAPPQLFVKWLLSMGWAGVDLFFVLSGFLITGILLDTRPAENYFQSFYARRALRIFPLYIAFLVVGFMVFPFAVARDWLPVPGDRWLYLCYLTNWLGLWKGPWRHSVMAHLWSLAVEEQFYFCWPLLAWVLRPATLLRTVLAGEIAVIGARVWLVLAQGPSQAISLATVTRMDGLLLGAACAILVRRYPLSASALRRLPLAGGIGLYLYAVMALKFRGSEAFNQLAGIPLLSGCFSLLVLYAVLTDGKTHLAQRALGWQPLRRVGNYAYGIYVYHVPILYFEDRLIAKFVPAGVRASTLFGCAAIATLFLTAYFTAKFSYTYFESIFLNWKDRFAARYAS